MNSDRVLIEAPMASEVPTFMHFTAGSYGQAHVSLIGLQYCSTPMASKGSLGNRITY